MEMSYRFKLAIKLALREMRTGLKGFRIFIACLALGVAAVCLGEEAHLVRLIPHDEGALWACIAELRYTV